MGLIITKGYLIKKIDFEVFDEIITFINIYGNKFTCLSKGSKKIISKNGRNLNFGCLCEFQFFASRSENKISRLVKCKMLDNFPILDQNESFFLLLDVINNLNFPSVRNYNFFEQMIKIVKENDNQLTQLIILRQFCKFSGIELNVSKCVNCDNKKIATISFKQHGLLCHECYQKDRSERYDTELTKLFINLFSNKYELIDLKNKFIPLTIKLLKTYINNNLGIKLF